MNEDERFAATLRWFNQVMFGIIWFLILDYKLDKIIKLLEGK